MSYVTATGGLGSYGGFGYHGLGEVLTIDWARGNQPVQAVQQQLQRLNFLEPGTGPFGSDGKWGPRTETALRAAARYVGWEGEAYDPSYGPQRRSGSVEVKDDLLDRLRAAQPAPPGTPGAVATEPVRPDAPVAPAPEELPVRRPPTEPRPSAPGWIPAAIIGGAAILVGLAVATKMRRPKRRVAANRRKRRRRRS